MLKRTDNRKLSLEPLESRRVLAVVISEILASNDNGIRDEDYNRPDWIELLNANDQAVDLDGWFLTDDPDDLDKWQFPSVQLLPQQRAVVFASGKNRAPVDGELHTNFRLNIEGGFVALVQPDGMTIEDKTDPLYPSQIKDVSFGIPQSVRSQTLIEPGGSARLFVPTELNGGSQLGDSWTAKAFDDSTWVDGTNAIGFEDRSGYESIFTTDLGGTMYQVNASAYMRMQFDLEDASSVFSMTLGMQYDDGYVAYINGQEVARRNAPEVVEWGSSATEFHADRFAVQFEDAVINPFEFPDLLVDGQNVLAIHAMNDDVANGDFLMVPRLTAEVFGELQTSARQFFSHPTPGEPNGDGTSASILDVTHSPRIPETNNEITVNATVSSTSGQVATVTLHYRTMFEEEQQIQMFDDGQHDDDSAGDGVYGAIIPANVASPGQMVRYYVTAEAAAGDSARLPTFGDPSKTEQYFGTVINDPTIDSDLKVIHWFLEDADAKNSRGGTRGSLFHDGKFYDNVLVDPTGRTVGLAGPKRSHDVFLPADHWFELEIDNQVFRMNDFDLISDYWNRAKVRVPLGYQTLNDVGTPAHYSIPVRIHENGEFYGTYSFVDGGNEQFLNRAGLDTGGALYKMNLGFSTARGVYKKQTRNFEDASDLGDFFDGLALEGEERHKFLMDNVNISATVNYLVGLVIMGHGDCCNKNLYIYRDTETNGEWEPLPWDVDSAFGRGGVGVAQDIFPTAGGFFTGLDNPLFKALFDDVPEFRDMYLRRMRTLLDEFIQEPDTPADQLYFEHRVDQMAAELASSVPLDFEKWGSWTVDPETGRVLHSHDNPNTWQDHLQILKEDYFPARRRFLYSSLRNANGGTQLDPRPDTPAIQISEIEASPETGNPDEEYLVLHNVNPFAVDVTGWQLSGDIQYQFEPGTVIPADGKLYVSPDVNSFRARASGPSGGQALFIEGNYSGHIPNQGGQFQLQNQHGTVIDRAVTEASLAPVQESLRITELMNNPRPELESRFDNDDFEYIELMNISPTETLQLQHVEFASGILFDFPEYSLAPQARAVVVSNQSAFVVRYGDAIPIIGEYGRTENGYRLSNGGEAILLQLGDGEIIQSFTYDDKWHVNTDGSGPSLVIVDPVGALSSWNQASGWKASDAADGTPGASDDGPADLNNDGVISADDIDYFCSGLRGNDLQFDFDNDQKVGESDLLHLVQDRIRTSIGDANLDGTFDSSDFVTVFQAAEFEDGVDGNSTWAEGDWNCDGDFTTTDLVFAFQFGKFDRSE
ncbi:MAG: lamin tail domain-containing protein [Planctomycetales bacterium]|nr:lamin tail domain-containing protein [Planctomycetales bacterium]